MIRIRVSYSQTDDLEKVTLLLHGAVRKIKLSEKGKYRLAYIDVDPENLQQRDPE